MIILPDITYHQFQCEWCSRIYKSKFGVLNHEAKCYKNPIRDCPSCDNTGLIVHREIHFPFNMVRMSVETTEEVCGACKIAEKLGGKSYIK